MPLNEGPQSKALDKGQTFESTGIFEHGQAGRADDGDDVGVPERTRGH